MKTLALLLVAGVNISDGQEPKRQCRAAEWPKRLPALDAVVDSAALLDLIDTSSAGDTTSVLVSILYKEDGTASVRLLETAGAPSPEAALFLQIVSSGLRRMAPSGPLGALRVRLRAGPGRSGTVERSVYCPPVPAPGGAPGASETIRVDITPGDRMPSGGKLRVALQIFIDEAGGVSDVRLISSSGIRDLDESVMAQQRQRRFRPATIDGLAIPSWTRNNGSSMRL